MPGGLEKQLSLTPGALNTCGRQDSNFLSILQATTPFDVLNSRAAMLLVVPVVAWGNGCSGQTNIPLVASNTLAIAAGRNHSAALQAGGTVIAWGDSGYGQSNVPMGLSSVIAVAAALVVNRSNCQLQRNFKCA